MNTRALVVCLACSLVLGGCATAKKELRPAAVPTLLSLMDNAELAIREGRNDQGLTFLATATTSYPEEKMPWLRMAQLNFECHDYGRAISSAQHVVARDGDDVVAHSILAASGLRVSSKALADLTHKNNLSGSVRNEAQDLAKLLRTTLGEETLVATRPVKREAKPRPANAAPQPARQQPGSDPFGALK